MKRGGKIWTLHENGHNTVYWLDNYWTNLHNQQTSHNYYNNSMAKNRKWNQNTDDIWFDGLKIFLK
jgi:hypothetical protein